jgi:hypothetical protein
MKKVEIIQMVANHYNRSNRAAGRFGGCYYRTDDGKMCAVGMCMNDEAIDEYGDYVGSISEISGQIINRGESLDSVFKEEYRGHDVFFWDELQGLHDGKWNWTDEGLSEEGEQAVTDLIKKYSDDNT